MKGPTTMRDRERGSAMLITLILVAALLAGAAVLASMQIGSTRGADVTRTGMSALYCAEAGLTAAHTVVSQNTGNWTGSGNLYSGTGTPTEPSWLYTGIGATAHDLDGDGSADFLVYLKDDDDEIGTQNYTSDSNQKIFIVSRCVKYGETIKEVEELISASGGGACYHSQLGNCFNNGNGN